MIAKNIWVMGTKKRKRRTTSEVTIGRIVAMNLKKRHSLVTKMGMTIVSVKKLFYRPMTPQKNWQRNLTSTLWSKTAARPCP